MARIRRNMERSSKSWMWNTVLLHDMQEEEEEEEKGLDS